MLTVLYILIALVSSANIADARARIFYTLLFSGEAHYTPADLTRAGNDYRAQFWTEFPMFFAFWMVGYGLIWGAYAVVMWIVRGFQRPDQPRA